MRAQSALSGSEADARARAYLSMDRLDRDASTQLSELSHPDVLLAITRLLRAGWDSDPRTTAAEAELAYRWLQSSVEFGFFDEKDFFLGELALIAGSSNRQLGQLEDAERWLDRSEASYAHTVNPAPSLANVTYARLALHFDRGRYEHVLELAPALVRSFERLDMNREASKCRFLVSLALKMTGRRQDCLATLEALGESLAAADPDLRTLVRVTLGEMLLADGQTERAVKVLADARNQVDDSRPTALFAQLCGVFGEALSHESRLAEAIVAYRASVSTFHDLGFASMEAYMRLALADTLLANGEARQAEWEVLAALPTISEQGLEAEGRAAIALLYKSARARKTDAGALNSLRQQLRNAT